MKLKRPRPYKKAKIVIIPLIDVMFFLLVTFMLASLSMQNLNSIRVNLPKGSAKPIKNPQFITLSIDKTGQIYINKTPVTLQSLQSVISSIPNYKNIPLIVSADKDAPNGIVVEAMLSAQKAGITKFLMAVQKK